VVLCPQCKIPRHFFLNQLLLQGSNVANNLVELLLRFQKESIAISCDIEKDVFFQFSVKICMVAKWGH
jgi:hypothetical protein